MIVYVDVTWVRFNLELLNFAVEVEVTVEWVVVRGRLIVTVPNQILVEVHHLLVELPRRCFAQLHPELNLVITRRRRSSVRLRKYVIDNFITIISII